MIDRTDLASCMADYTDALTVKDVTRAGSYLADDFAIVFVHPHEQIVDKTTWLKTVPHFDTHEYRVQREVVRVRADSAIASRLVFMRATTRGVARIGQTNATDYWSLDPEQGWQCWQRVATPLDPGVGTIPQSEVAL